MIKKLFKILSLWLLFIPFYTNWFSAHSVGAFTPSVADSSYSISVFNYWDVYTEHWDIEDFVFAPRNDLLFYRDSNSNPILLLPYAYSTRYWWQLNYYYLCDEIPDTNFAWLTNCSSIQLIDWVYLEQFMSSIGSSDNWAYNYIEGLNERFWFDLCFSSKALSKSMCFWVRASSSNARYDLFVSDPTTLYWYAQGVSVFSWWNFTDLTYTLDTIPITAVWVSPWWIGQWWNPNVPIEAWNWLSWYVYIEVNSWDYVDYFEDQLHFTKDLCYIWTRDLNSVYEDRIPYYQWTWYTIFDWFYHLYWTNKVSINKLWLWLNTIYFNYRSWFMWENRDQYNEVISNMIMTWQQAITSPQLVFGPWLTNPFLWNPSYLFFIWSTALEWHIDLYTAWQDIALYCYYQMQDYSNDWITFTITDDYDHRWLDNNVAVNSRYKNSQWSLFSWASQIVWQNRDWTPLDYFKSWSWDLYVDDPIQWFSDQFNKFKVSYWQMNPSDLDLWVLPWYIILFMIAIIFFRFLAN